MELKQAEWERVLGGLWNQVDKTPADAGVDWLSAPWKVSMAEALRRRTTAPNRWIAEKLNMGAPNSVSQYLAWARAGRISIRILKP